MNNPTFLRRVRASGGFLLLAAAYILTNQDAWSQQQQGPSLPSPRLHIVAPNGAKAGSTFELTLTGQDLDEASELLFNVPGVKAELVSSPPPSEMKKGNQPKALVSARFKVSVPANVPPGIHDVRLVNRWGVSNPRAFVIGDQEEIEEKEPNNDVGEAQRVPLGCSITGVISTPTDVDYYSFEGKKGQRVVVSCLTSSIDSKLQPQLQLYSRSGGLLASNRDYSDFDAVVDATLPDDGEYYVRVLSFTYTQGTVEHFYRLTISTAPWIDAVVPPMVEPGKETKVTVYGRNLPGGVLDPASKLDGRTLEKAVVTVKPPADAKAMQRLAFTGHVAPRMSGQDGFELRLKNAAGVSNPFLIGYAHAPVVIDNEQNDTAETAQQVSVPCEIAGRIEKIRDRDWYRFSVKKGETYSLEAIGDRIGSPMDLYFTLKQVGGKGAAQEFDDNPELLHPVQFYARTDDPQRYRLTATEDASYLLQISSRDADIQGGPRHQYRLRIAAERPDFRLIVLPQAVSTPEGNLLHAGTSQAYTVLVWRNDGFTGDIALAVDGLPKGVTCPPQSVGGAMKQGSLVLLADSDAKTWTGPITVKGTAMIDGKKIEVEARPGDVTWTTNQQNVPVVSRLSRSLVLAVRPGAAFQLTATPEKTEVAPGTKLTVHLKLARLDPNFKGPVQVRGLNMPNNTGAAFNNNNQPLTLNPGKDDATATIDLQRTLPPGTYTFALTAQAQVPFSRDPAATNKTNANVVLSSTPITVTILPK
jgi:hypothetical protein